MTRSPVTRFPVTRFPVTRFPATRFLGAGPRRAGIPWAVLFASVAIVGLPVPAGAVPQSTAGSGAGSTAAAPAGSNGAPAGRGGRRTQVGAPATARADGAGASDPSPAAQDRELDQIGHDLLSGTPHAPAGSTEQTGGGTTP